MNCPHCAATTSKKRVKKTKLGYTIFFCPPCKRTFNERTGTTFNYLEFPTEGERHFFARPFPPQEKDSTLEASEGKGRKIDAKYGRTVANPERRSHQWNERMERSAPSGNVK